MFIKESIKTFFDLLETLSFSQTAKRRHISQSAISQQMQKLESVLGKKLFIRQGKKIAPTNEAIIIQKYIHKIFKITEDCILELEQGVFKEKIILGAPEDFAALYLPQILSKFQKENPHIALHVQCAFTKELMQNFSSGDYDAILIKEKANFPGCTTTPVRRDKLVWVGAEGAELSKESLALVLAPEPDIYRQRALDALRSKGIHWNIVYSSTSFMSNLSAVKSGMGFTVIPENLVENPLTIVGANLLPDLLPADISLIAQNKPTAAIKKFFTFFQKFMKASSK
jgi:DNA-binding transcriptional LysR family regulator